MQQKKQTKYPNIYLQVGLRHEQSLLIPGIRHSAASIFPLVFKRFIKAIEDRSKKHLSKLFEMVYPFQLLFLVFPFRIEVDQLVGVVPVLVKYLDAHNIITFRIVRNIVPPKISV